MKKKAFSLLCFLLSSLLFTSPVLANTISVTENRTTGSTSIDNVGGGSYKQVQVETSTVFQVDLITVSADYYIVNSYIVGSPSNSNQWSTKAYAQMTYASGYVMGCRTHHTSKKGTTVADFYTSDMY